MRPKVIGIRCSFSNEDARTKDKVMVPVKYVDENGVVRAKEVSLTQAEKSVVESIAMRLLMDYKRLIRKTKTDDGRIVYEGMIIVGSEKKR